jgi:hypothetical protein
MPLLTLKALIHDAPQVNPLEDPNGTLKVYRQASHVSPVKGKDGRVA